MITQNQIKSFKKCINPKAFNPLLSKLHYRKDKNVFVFEKNNWRSVMNTGWR